MTKKATLTPIVDVPNIASAINTSLNAINDKLDNTVSRDGSTPNTMNADLDLNSNDLLNVANTSTAALTISGTRVYPSSLVTEASPFYQDRTAANFNEALARFATGDIFSVAGVDHVIDPTATTTASAAWDFTIAGVAYHGAVEMDDVAAVLADTLTFYPTGTVIEAIMGGFAYTVAATAATDHHATTAGGVKLYRVAGQAVSAYDDVGLLTIAGTIRNNGTQAGDREWWKLIDASGHTPVGFRDAADADPIETTDTYIRVHHAIGGDSTGQLTATLDETLAQTGLRIGCSVGTDYSDIYFYRNIMAQITKSAGGVWAASITDGPLTVAWNASGYLDLTFPACPNAAAICNKYGSAGLGEWTASFTQVTNTTGRLYFVRSKPLYHSARVRWNGSAMVAVGASEGITVGTFASGLTPITFDSGDVNTFDMQVTAGAGTAGGAGYRPVVVSPASGSCTVKLVNAAGTVVTTGDTNMEFFIRARSRVQGAEPGVSTAFILQILSRSQLNPKSVLASDFASGNIWLTGCVMKNRV